VLLPRKILAWLIEMLLQALMFGVSLVMLVRPIGRPTMLGAGQLFVAILLVFILCGYAEILLILRLTIKQRFIKYYPLAALLAFYFVFELWNWVLPNGLFDSHRRNAFRLSAFLVVPVATYVATIVGNQLETRVARNEAG
jgi:hypothetical protein